MTTDGVTRSAISKMLTGRRKRLERSAQIYAWLFAHLGIWGPPKVGKSYLGLNARSSEVRLPDSMEGFDFKKAGKVLIPSKPLSVAYANFDREAGTVLKDLQGEIDIITEDFYLDDEGELIIPVLMKPADFLLLFEKFAEFLGDAEKAEVDLVFVDGGSIIWEEVREWLLPKEDPDKAGGHSGPQPSQYNTSNTTMRASIMQRLHGVKAHTIISREAGTVWKSASETLKDANGNQVLRPDGWNKTGHYIDLDVQMKLIETNMGATRVAIPAGTALIPSILGRTIEEPSFAKLFEANYRRPLILRADVDEYQAAVAEHGELSYGVTPATG
jgi:hypothetical protein